MTGVEQSPNGEAVDDFDAFWSSYSRGHKSVRILGRDMPLPKDVPLWVLMSRVDPNDDEQIKTLVSELYGPEALDQWIADGMGMFQLSVLIGWTIARVQGDHVTFEKAAQRTEELMHNPPGNRAARRQGKGKKKKPKPTN